jgi:hypothetical protein
MPLALAGYLAVRVSNEGAELRRRGCRACSTAGLPTCGRAGQALAGLERQLGEQLAAAPTSPDELRAFERRIPLARQVFRLDPEGRLVFPVVRDDTSQAEREFLERTRSIWTGGAILAGTPRPGEPGKATRRVPGLGDNLVDLAAREPHGWLTWYWAEGLHLLFWRRATDGGVVGVELERVGVLARVVGSLPTAPVDGRMELADSRGQTVHQC